MVILNFILIIVGFAIIIRFPYQPFIIVLGMSFIAISIITFAVLIYFPPQQPQYVRLKVVEETPKTMSRTSLKPKKRKKIAKKPKRRARR